MITPGFVIPEFSVVHKITTSLNTRAEIPPVVYLTQYDQTIPILAIQFQCNFDSFTLPETVDANIRMEKPDHTHVYNPAIGVSDDRMTLYVAVTPQMTAAFGTAEAIIEILDDTKVVGTSGFTIDIARNPLPIDVYESSDEYKTIQQILEDMKELDKSTKENAEKAAESERQAKQYSGNPPIIEKNSNGIYTWRIWDADQKVYVDTNKVAVGNVMYATFHVDPSNGHLYMVHDISYTGPTFEVNNGRLEAVLNVPD